jgi:hypothetical protein
MRSLIGPSFAALALTMIAPRASAQSIAPPPALAADSENDAIRDFLSIGLAAAPTAFHSIQGSSLDDMQMQYAVAKQPEGTYFGSCSVSHYSDDDQSAFTCISARSVISDDVLLASTSRALQAALPSGYTTEGPHPYSEDSGRAGQSWSGPGKPTVSFVIHTEPGGVAYYKLTVWAEGV